MPENPETVPNPPNQIDDKAPKPKGVIPKNAQSLVIIGVAVLMILIMWLTGGKKAAVAPVSTTPPPPPVTPTDSSKVEAFKQAIQAEQQEAMQPNTTQRGAGADGGSSSGTPNPYSQLPGQNVAYPAGSNGIASPPGASGGEATSPQPPADRIKADEKRREYESLFASNVALTYRQGEAAEKLTASSDGPVPGGPSSSPDPQTQALRDAEVLGAIGPSALDRYTAGELSAGRTHGKESRPAGAQPAPGEARRSRHCSGQRVRLRPRQKVRPLRRNDPPHRPHESAQWQLHGTGELHGHRERLLP